MNFYDTLIKTALLGTERSAIDWSAMPETIQERQVAVIENRSQEEQFLSLLALATNYKNAGLIPVKDIFDSILPSEEETKPYCSQQALSLLRYFLTEDNHPLLGIWLSQCADKQLLVPPVFLPKLFDIARNSLEYREQVVKIMGNRGTWLLGLHPFFKHDLKLEISNENWAEILAHGNLEQRVDVLKMLWESDAPKATEYVRNNWKSASAKEKVAFLATWKTFATLEDEMFILEQLENKAQSVREQALDILKILPNSHLAQQFQYVLAAAFAKKIDTKLMVMKTTKITFDAPLGIDDIFFKRGIEKESTDKQFSNPEFWINQIMASVNPEFWEQHFELSPKEIVAQFAAQKALKKFLDALVLATVKFKNSNWAVELLPNTKIFDIQLLEILPLMQKMSECEKYVGRFPNETMTILSKAGIKQWTLEYSRQLMEYYSKNVYHFNRGTYKNIVPYLHKDTTKYMTNLLSEKESYYPYWQNITKDIEELLVQREELFRM